MAQFVKLIYTIQYIYGGLFCTCGGLFQEPCGYQIESVGGGEVHYYNNLSGGHMQPSRGSAQAAQKAPWILLEVI